jgi:ABC-type glycerol-3-phosphate transport system permease component
MNITQRSRQSGTASVRSWRGPQLGLHAIVAILLLLTLIPIYLMVEVSFKNPIQYLYQRWVPSFPLRLGNYALISGTRYSSPRPGCWECLCSH